MSEFRALAAPIDVPAPPRRITDLDTGALRASVRRPRRVALLLIVLFVGGFGGWASVAPLAGGAVAPGVISPDGSRKIVQHLEGGIIGELHVRDGDTVTAGAPLVMLQDVQPRAAHEALLNEYHTLLATRTRLLAEQNGLAVLEWPEELQAAAREGRDLQPILDGQHRMFETRRRTLEARRQVLAQRIEQLNEQVQGMRAQVEAASMQIRYIEEEVVGKEELLAQRVITKPELLRLKRMQAELLGRRGEYIGTIASNHQKIGETRLQLLALDAEWADEISSRLDEVRAELATVRERLHASEDVLARTIVSAPVSGTVVNLHFKTEGGVVQPGEPIMEIVPADDALLIDARVAPTDIDVVHGGMKAQVHLSAYSTRRVPRIDGVVRSVSADRLIDEVTRQPYYLARVEVDRDHLSRVAPEIELVSGMPAEVLIVTGERTMIQYLVEPFMDAFRRSFRET